MAVDKKTAQQRRTPTCRSRPGACFVVVSDASSPPLGDDVLARDPRALHLGHDGRHVPLEPVQPLNGALEAGLDALLALQLGHPQRAGLALRRGSVPDHPVVEVVVVLPHGRADALGVVGGDFGGHGALERRHVLEQLLLLRDEVGDLAALARVEGLVDGVWRRCGASEDVGRYGEAVDDEVGRG